MLRSFRLGNHRSFRDEQELLLMPAYTKDRLALPVTAIYGANASGKSNLLDGLRFMAEAVRDSFGSWSPDGGVPRKHFKLDPDARDKSSVFVVDLVDGDVRYTYGFELDDIGVRSEWLYSYPEKRRRVIFERESNDVKFGTTVADLRSKLEVLEGLLRPNALFLGLAAQANLGPLLPVYHWLTAKLVFRLDLGGRPPEREIVQLARSSPDLLVQIVELLRVADLGVSGMVITEGALTLEEQIAATDAEGVNFPYSAQGSETEDEAIRKLYDKARARPRVRLTHGVSRELFTLSDESAGTLSWLWLLPAVLKVIKGGGTLVIDEIDASLHPRLTARLVALFRDIAFNPHSAQLIFTTHDASLLSPVLGEEVLKREEVWFVEKRQSGASELYPLTDFHPRKEGENLERRYLGGSYGAVPNVLEEDFARAMISFGGADGSA